MTTLLLASSLVALSSPGWVIQKSRTVAQFRGIWAINEKVCWASGTGGTVARTVDGHTWSASVVPGARDLDFRDIVAFSDKAAFILSIGPGDKSRIYKTVDGGKKWVLQFTSKNPREFFDAFAFWDSRHGIAVSDPVDGRFVLMSTSDGGAHWRELRSDMPEALKGEGCFAASGTCIRTLGAGDVWIATGGAQEARVFHSSDRGRHWTVAATPVVAGADAAGIFSVRFLSTERGVVVGGDYKNVETAYRVLFTTGDGGKHWVAPKGGAPFGFREWVGEVPGSPGPTLITVGPNGSEISMDGGHDWNPIAGPGFHCASFAGVNAGWAAGAKGLIAKFEM